MMQVSTPRRALSDGARQNLLRRRGLTPPPSSSSVAVPPSVASGSKKKNTANGTGRFGYSGSRGALDSHKKTTSSSSYSLKENINGGSPNPSRFSLDSINTMASDCSQMTLLQRRSLEPLSPITLNVETPVAGSKTFIGKTYAKKNKKKENSSSLSLSSSMLPKQPSSAKRGVMMVKSKQNFVSSSPSVSSKNGVNNVPKAASTAATAASTNRKKQLAALKRIQNRRGKNDKDDVSSSANVGASSILVSLASSDADMMPSSMSSKRQQKKLATTSPKRLHRSFVGVGMASSSSTPPREKPHECILATTASSSSSSSMSAVEKKSAALKKAMDRRTQQNSTNKKQAPVAPLKHPMPSSSTATGDTSKLSSKISALTISPAMQKLVFKYGMSNSLSKSQPTTPHGGAVPETPLTSVSLASKKHPKNKNHPDMKKKTSYDDSSNMDDSNKVKTTAASAASNSRGRQSWVDVKRRSLSRSRSLAPQRNNDDATPTKKTMVSPKWKSRSPKKMLPPTKSPSTKSSKKKTSYYDSIDKDDSNKVTSTAARAAGNSRGRQSWVDVKRKSLSRSRSLAPQRNNNDAAPTKKTMVSPRWKSKSRKEMLSPRKSPATKSSKKKTSYYDSIDKDDSDKVKTTAARAAGNSRGRQSWVEVKRRSLSRSRSLAPQRNNDDATPTKKTMVSPRKSPASKSSTLSSSFYKNQQMKKGSNSDESPLPSSSASTASMGGSRGDGGSSRHAELIEKHKRRGGMSSIGTNTPPKIMDSKPTSPLSSGLLQELDLLSSVNLHRGRTRVKASSSSVASARPPPQAEASSNSKINNKWLLLDRGKSLIRQKQQQQQQQQEENNSVPTSHLPPRSKEIAAKHKHHQWAQQQKSVNNADQWGRSSSSNNKSAGGNDTKKKHLSSVSPNKGDTSPTRDPYPTLRMARSIENGPSNLYRGGDLTSAASTESSVGNLDVTQSCSFTNPNGNELSSSSSSGASMHLRRKRAREVLARRHGR